MQGHNNISTGTQKESGIKQKRQTVRYLKVTAAHKVTSELNHCSGDILGSYPVPPQEAGLRCSEGWKNLHNESSDKQDSITVGHQQFDHFKNSNSSSQMPRGRGKVSRARLSDKLPMKFALYWNEPATSQPATSLPCDMPVCPPCEPKLGRVCLAACQHTAWAEIQTDWGGCLPNTVRSSSAW